jgi:hypothetical protein
MRVGALFWCRAGLRADPPIPLPHCHFVGHFQGGAADSADYGRAVSAGEWIGDFAATSGTVEKGLRLGFVV